MLVDLTTWCSTLTTQNVFLKLKVVSSLLNSKMMRQWLIIGMVRNTYVLNVSPDSIGLRQKIPASDVQMKLTTVMNAWQVKDVLFATRTISQVILETLVKDSLRIARLDLKTTSIMVRSTSVQNAETDTAMSQWLVSANHVTSISA